MGQLNIHEPDSPEIKEAVQATTTEQEVVTNVRGDLSLAILHGILATVTSAIAIIRLWQGNPIGAVIPAGMAILFLKIMKSAINDNRKKIESNICHNPPDDPSNIEH